MTMQLTHSSKTANRALYVLRKKLEQKLDDFDALDDNELKLATGRLALLNKVNSAIDPPTPSFWDRPIATVIVASLLTMAGVTLSSATTSWSQRAAMQLDEKKLEAQLISDAMKNGPDQRSRASTLLFLADADLIHLTEGVRHRIKELEKQGIVFDEVPAK